jgi:uncharacterized membrane protein YhiD involved in acid resistance
LHGLTTAASIWVTAAWGVLCGLGAWKLLVVAVAGVLFLLLAGGSIEKWCQKALGIVEKAEPPDSRYVFGGVANAFSVKSPAA